MFFKKQLANILSLARLFVASPLVVIGVLNKDALMTFLVIGLGFLSDALDGITARFLSGVSEFGKWIDPFADKVFLFSFLGATIAAYDIWSWELIPPIVIDCLLIFISGAIAFTRFRKYYYGAHWSGKIKFVIYTAAVFMLSGGAFLNKGELINIAYSLFLGGSVFGCMSLGVYIAKAIKGYLKDTDQLRIPR